MKRSTRWNWILFRLAIPSAIALLAGGVATWVVSNLAFPSQYEKEIAIQRDQSLTIPPSKKIVLIAITPETPLKLKREGGQVTLDEVRDLLEETDRFGNFLILFDKIYERVGFDESVPVKTPAANKLWETLASLQNTKVVLATGFISKSKYPEMYEELLDRSEPSGAKAFTQPSAIWEGPPSKNVYPGLVEHITVNDVYYGAPLARQDRRTGRTILYAPLAAVLMHEGIPLDSVQLDRSKGTVSAARMKWLVDPNDSVDVRFTETANPFRTLDFADFVGMLKRKDVASLQNKILIVGDIGGTTDVVETSKFGPIAGPVFIAHMANTLMWHAYDRGTHMPPWLAFAYATLLAGISAFSFASTKRFLILSATPAALAIGLFFPDWGLKLFDANFETVTPLVAIAVAAIAYTVLGFGIGFKRNLRVPGSIVETTVLFGDVSGSTQHLVEKGSERHRQEVEAILRLVQRAVRNHQGEVERTLGDGFIATFQHQEGHALHAARAALEIFESLEELRTSGRTCLEMTFGLESGPVTGGYVMEQGRRSWSSAGQAVNLAQRIQASCVELGIKVGIGPTATTLIGERLNTRQVSIRPMRGFDQDIAIATME